MTLKDSDIKLAKVDATLAKELANDYEIKGFPTIKFFKKGKATEYNGGRTTSEIVAWVNKKSGPIAKTIATEDDLVALEEANEASILGVFESVDSINARNYLKLASDSEDELAFAISTDEAIKSKLGLTADTIVVLKQFDDKRADLPIGDTFDEKAVTTFINGDFRLNLSVLFEFVYVECFWLHWFNSRFHTLCCLHLIPRGDRSDYS